MSNAPPHAAEHDDLMVTLARLTERSKTINAVILITIDHEGRPCIGGNLDHPGQIMDVMRQMVEAEDLIVNIAQVPIPKGN